MSLLDTDARTRQALRRLEHRARLPLKKYRDEILELMRTVPTVRLRDGRERMEDAHTALQVKRSRLAYIKAECLREVGYLRDLRRGLEDWLVTRYVQPLRTGASNDRGRQAMVSRALEPLDARIQPISRLLETVEIALVDYDSRKFGFRDLVAANRIGDRPD